jgi:hypothetical protein
LVVPLQVSDREAKGYSAIIKNKMALSNMKTKQMRRDYSSIDEFNEDVELIVSNCLTFNTSSPKYQEVSLSIVGLLTVTVFVTLRMNVVGAHVPAALAAVLRRGSARLAADHLRGRRARGVAYASGYSSGETSPQCGTLTKRPRTLRD